METGERILRGAVLIELRIALRVGEELAASELRAAGVDPAEYGFVSIVGVLQPVTRARLTAATGLARTTLSDALRPVIERGHVSEQPNPRDRRSTLLTLTPAGQAIFERGLPAFHRFLAHVDDALGGRLDEHEQAVWELRTALQRLSDEGSTAEEERTMAEWQRRPGPEKTAARPTRGSR